jgi:murein DD-endopeptidase MepM/ murein hydrolase activator NlpD
MFVRVGQRVSQGQRIAAVGSSGLSTGPHLDFRLRRKGGFVDFERLRAPRATVLAAARMGEFVADRDRFSALMDDGVRSMTTALANAIPSAADAGGAN